MPAQLEITEEMIQCFHFCAEKGYYQQLFDDYQLFVQNLCDNLKYVEYSDGDYGSESTGLPMAYMANVVSSQLRIFLKYFTDWNPEKPSQGVKNAQYLEEKAPKLMFNLKNALTTKNWDRFYELYRSLADYIMQTARSQNIINIRVEHKPRMFDTFEERDLYITSLKEMTNIDAPEEKKPARRKIVLPPSWLTGSDEIQNKENRGDTISRKKIVPPSFLSAAVERSYQFNVNKSESKAKLIPLRSSIPEPLSVETHEESSSMPVPQIRRVQSERVQTPFQTELKDLGKEKDQDQKEAELIPSSTKFQSQMIETPKVHEPERTECLDKNDKNKMNAYFDRKLMEMKVEMEATFASKMAEMELQFERKLCHQKQLLEEMKKAFDLKILYSEETQIIVKNQLEASLRELVTDVNSMRTTKTRNGMVGGCTTEDIEKFLVVLNMIETNLKSSIGK